VARSRLVLLGPDGPRPARRWLARSPGLRAYRVVHVVGELDDVCRIAPVASALDDAGAFEHVVVDTSPGQDAGRALRELGVPARTRPLDVGGRSTARRLGALLEGFEALLADETPIVAIVYADDDAALACALSAAKRQIPLIQAQPRAGEAALEAAANGALLHRLADLVLATDPAHEDQLVRQHVPRHRIRVVGDPLVDLVRRHARRSAAVEVCGRHGVEPGRYVLVTLAGSASPSLADPVRALAARLPVLLQLAEPAPELSALIESVPAKVIEPPSVAARLCLERAAGAIITDSRRVIERAAVLGVPSRLIKGEAWDLTGLRTRRRGVGLGSQSLRDGGAPGRLADAIIANFARVVPVTP